MSNGSKSVYAILSIFNGDIVCQEEKQNVNLLKLKQQKEAPKEVQKEKQQKERNVKHNMLYHHHDVHKRHGDISRYTPSNTTVTLKLNPLCVS